MKRALILGASGLLGSHMATKLKAEDYHVTGVSRSRQLHTACDEYIPVDLRDLMPSHPMFRNVDEVYNFACEVGGLGYIADKTNDAEIMRNSTMIDIAVLEAIRHRKQMSGTAPVLFFASSACVYNVPGKRFYIEADAYPACCSNEFAWQKLFAERLYRSYMTAFDIDVRVARLFNTYGAGMTWRGGREKAVAALCRKVAQAKDGDALDVWGFGEQTRSFMHVDDAVDGIYRLMQRAPFDTPVNLGPPEEVTINELLALLMEISGKRLFKKFNTGPTGVSKICADTTKLRQLIGWEPPTKLEKGLPDVYRWVENQVLTAAK